MEMDRWPYEFKKVALGDISVYEPAQRLLNPARVSEFMADFNFTACGEPVVSLREGRFYVIDGQHRCYALRELMGAGWEILLITCKVYRGLVPAQEALMFRLLNTVLRTNAFDKFKVAITEGREAEVKIKAIVEGLGLHISRKKDGRGSIGAVGALRKSFDLSQKSLVFALKLATECYGDAGLEGTIIEGFAHLHHRYTNAVDDAVTVDALSKLRGGSRGLLNSAEKRKAVVGTSLPVCIAAEAVDVINRYRRGKKLPSWWAVA